MARSAMLSKLRQHPLIKVIQQQARSDGRLSAEGKLNPKTYPTKAGFLRHFAAWLIEDLPFTTGEAPGLHRLFKYLEITYQTSLGHDSSQCSRKNFMLRLHGEVVRELSVGQHQS